MPLSGSVWSLTAPDGSYRVDTSDRRGMVRFLIKPGVAYTLMEVTPPAGYRPTSASFLIEVDACGRLSVDGQCVKSFVLPNERSSVTGGFTAVKVNRQTDAPIPGALLSLRMGTQLIAMAASNEQGAIAFYDLPPGTYQLAEIITPPGFSPMLPKTVIVSESGEATIDGQSANGYRLADIPAYPFSFVKRAADTGAALPGAAFELSMPGGLILAATSDARGIVDFGTAAPGTYSMAETVAPVGYLPNPRIYSVVIGEDGTIAIDGQPLASFSIEDDPFPVSPPPLLNPIYVGDSAVSGTGNPGCSIALSFEGGAQTAATVMANGTWNTAIPANASLDVNDEVVAVQTCTGASPGAPVIVFVQPRLVAYSVRYYQDSVSAPNLLGIISGMDLPRMPIKADLSLFAPQGHIVPGTRSGAVYVSLNPDDNVVNVVYPEPELLNWRIRYYLEIGEDALLIADVPGGCAPYGAAIALTEAQLDARHPGTGFNRGVQIDDPAILSFDGQAVRVVYTQS